MTEIPADLKFPRIYNIMTSKNLVADSKYSSIYITAYRKKYKKHRITKYCAAKLIKKSEYASENEYYITKNLNHPNVLKPLGINKSLVTMIFYPWMTGGTVKDYISNRFCLTEHDVRMMFKQMVEAVKYIHSVGIVHHDLKLDNFLITKNGHVKLSDFGLATYHPKIGYLKNHCGSPVYMAPEILLGGQHTYSADIWSLGICLYELIHGKTPFDHLKNIKELEKEVQKPIEYLVDNIELLDLLMRMLSFYIVARISIVDVSNHAWLNSESNALLSKEASFRKKYATI